MEDFARRIQKLEQSQQATVDGIIEKIMQLVKSKAVPFNKDQVFEQILNLKVVALETKHPKANYHSTVFQALREKMGGSDEQFKRYVLALLGDKDQEKVLDAMTKVDKALRVPSFSATPTFRGRDRGISLGGLQCFYCKGYSSVEPFACNKFKNKWITSSLKLIRVYNVDFLCYCYFGYL